jgi:hypothetical protein
MKRYRQLTSCLVVLLAVSLAITPVAFAAITPLSAATFAPGTIVVPMDDKQTDRIHVYGFIHEFLRNNPGSLVARIIEPPNVVLQTDLTPAGVLYQGGPFLIDAGYTNAVNTLFSNSTFSKVTFTRLTTTFTTNRVFFIRQPTHILVISDGYWGKTFLTLARMGISYTQISTTQAMANPSIVNSYTLIVLDSPGWYGNPSAYTPLHRSQITAVYNAIQARVAAGNEVMYTDAAIFDLNSTFPGYVKLGNPGETGSWKSVMHNPAAGDSGFDSEFPSQYYNPGPNPNQVTIFTEEGVGNWVPNGVQPGHTSDVRILMDTTNYGVPKLPYSMLAFYFPYGHGIVEGLALQPYEQLYPTYADYNGYYAVYQIYGNKFVEGLFPDFTLAASPPSVTVYPTQTATYQVAVTSVSEFVGTVNLQVSGLPSGAQAVFAPSGSVSLSADQSVTETLSVLTTAATPRGSYNLTITGSSTLPQITHSITVALNVQGPPPPDFGLTVSPPRVSIMTGQCGNLTITVTSLNSFNSAINLTLTGVPPHVSAQFMTNPITPSPGGTVGSILRLCPAPSAAPGNYTIVVTGTSGNLVHTGSAVLSIPAPTVVVVNWLIFLIVIGLLLLALGLALLFLFLSKKGPRRARVVSAAPSPVLVPPPPVLVPATGPRIRYVLPVPTVRCRYCGRVMPLNSVYCPFCGRPQVILGPPPARLVPTRGLGGRNVIAVVLALISGVLVLLNSAALLSPTFWAAWSSIFFWLPTIGQAYAFMIGAIVGLTIVLAAIIMALSNGALADVILFPFAIFSLLIGGGFIAGMLMGILAGILALVRRSR